MTTVFNTIDEALEDIRSGKIIILVDDEDRENEGDLVMAAESVTPEAINFMATHARGLICLTLTADRTEQLNLHPQTVDNTAPFGTAFTVSIDAARTSPREFRLPTGRRPSAWPSISPANPPISRSRDTFSLCGLMMAECSSGPVKPKAPSIWRVWPAGIRPGSSVKS